MLTLVVLCAPQDRYTFRRIVVRGMRERRQLYEKFLQSVQILDLLDPYERDNIADALHSVVFEHNQRIIEEGTVGDCMYFVEVGNVRVTKSDVRPFLFSLLFSSSIPRTLLAFCSLARSLESDCVRIGFQALECLVLVFQSEHCACAPCDPGLLLLRACRTASRRR